MVVEGAKQSRYVFQVTCEGETRAQTAKASSQEEAEKMIRERYPECECKFLWIYVGVKQEKPPVKLPLRVYAIFSAVFFASGFFIMYLDLPNYPYLFYAGTISLFLGVLFEAFHKKLN